MKRRTLSHSQLFAIQTCGEHYRRRYEDGDKTPGTAQMKRGLSVHVVAKHAHGLQLAAKLDIGPVPEALVGALPTVREAMEMGAAAFEAELAEGITVSRAAIADAGSRAAAIGKEKDTAVSLSGAYVRLVAPFVNPIAVERKVKIRPKLPTVGDAPFDVLGIYDLVEETKDGKEQISDTKTSGRRPPKDAALKSEQLPLYALLRAADNGGKLPHYGALRHMVDGRWPDVHTQEVEFTRERLGAVIARLETAYSAIEAGVFVPAQSGHWKCSEKWCEFWDSCRYAVGRRSPE